MYVCRRLAQDELYDALDFGL